MKDNFNRQDKKIVKLLQELREAFSLTPEEKAILKMKVTDSIMNLGSSVTKTSQKRYKWWILRIYKLNIRGVTMPFIPIIIAILLAGGAGTVALADTAKPGDVLYKLDQVMERIQERLPMSQPKRANFLARLSEERAEELLALRNIDPMQFNERAQERWESHQEKAMEGLAISIEKVEAVQEKFQEKLSLADTDEQKQVFQKVIDHLGEVKIRREDRITEIEERTFPGFKGLMVREKIRNQENVSQEIKQQIHNMIQEEFGDAPGNMGIGVGKPIHQQTPAEQN